MKAFVGFVLAALAASVSAQGVTAILTPTGAAPAGCTGTASGSYYLTVVKAGSAKAKRAPALEVSLSNGILTDSAGRIGYIASNYQFQFNKPPQAGSIYTAGWSLCSNTSLALGPTTLFYECFSGSFGNLYNQNIGAQCQPVNLDLLPASGAPAPPPASTPAASSAPPASTPTPTPTPVVTQTADGQPQATTPVAPPPQPSVSQISDGQVQATTPVSAFTGGAPIATMAAQLFAVAAGAAAMAL